jgi:LacI family transcriptional regulator
LERKVTLRDVAALAGYSIATVSVVLNDVPGTRVLDSTRVAVHAAAAELGYTPNRLARGLRLQRSNTLGFLSDEIVTTAFAGRMILGAQDAALERGSLLLLLNSNRDPALESREIDALIDHRVDGIVYAVVFHQIISPPSGLSKTKAVLLDARSVDASYPSVVPDEVGGGFTATEELLAAGHRRIGLLNNVDDIPATSGRLEGYRQALQARNMVFDPSLQVSDLSDSGGGFRAASQLLSREPRPTALFCFNDRMAMGAYQAAQEMGMSIPGDLSVVGFDDQLAVSSELRPGLTTVALPHYEMGYAAVVMLMDMIEKDDPDNRTQTSWPCTLIRRASVAPPS